MSNKPLVHRTATAYVDNVGLRALVQLIPQVGGPIDTLLAGKGAKIQERRLQDFLETLDFRIRALESDTQFPIITESEELYDFILVTLTDVIRARAAEKRRRLANLVAIQIVETREWSEAEDAERIMASLDEIHVQVLLEAINASEGSGVWKGTSPISLHESLKNSPEDLISLTEKLPIYPPEMLRLACAELLAKGLIHDEGVGRIGTKAMCYFVASDLGIWFASWLKA